MKTNVSFNRFLKANSYLVATAAWLITISFIINNYWSGNSSAAAARKNIAAYVLAQEEDFENLVKDTALIASLANRNYEEQLLNKLYAKKYFIYVYNQNDSAGPRLKFWNTQVAQPDTNLLFSDKKLGFIKMENGYFVWKKYQQNASTTIQLIPIKWNYSITNDYLTNTFTAGLNIENFYSLSDQGGPFAVNSKEGVFLFSLQQNENSFVVTDNFIATILRILAAILGLLFVQNLAAKIVQKNFYKAVLFLIIVVGLLRIISYYLPVPLNFRQYELFDPAIYATNTVFRSLGDLLINAMLVLWLVLFIRHYMQQNEIVIRAKNQFQKWLIVFAGIIVLLASTFFIGAVIRSMVADSQISFDVVNFFTLNFYSVIGFVVLGSLAIIFFFLSQIIIYLLQPLFPKKIFHLILIITVLGLAYLSISINQPGIVFKLYLLIWLLLYLLLLNIRQFYFFTYNIISTSLIFWLFYFSISISWIIIFENSSKEIEKLKNYANTLSTKADPSSERLMSTVLTDFRNDVLASIFPDFKNEATNNIKKDSLLNNNFSAYLNKYDTRIFTFDENENSLYNQDSTTFNTLNIILKTQGKPTAIPELFFYDVSYDQFTYISKKTITDTSGSVLGYLFILASPKKYKSDALYPELFLKGYNTSIENSPIYSFAVYNKLQLVSSHNDYAFPSHLNASAMPKTDFELHRKAGYDEIWYKAGVDKVVIIAKQNAVYIEAITLFSYLFCSFLFVTGFFWFLNAVIRSRFRWKELKGYWQMSIRNQVHATIIFMSLLSFLIVGVATVLFFINRYNNNNREKLSGAIHIMQSEIRNALVELSSFGDINNLQDAAYNDKLEQTISKISEVHSVDINLYSLDGKLRVSSLPLPYTKGILSNLMDPEAYYHLESLNEIQFYKNETIGSLNYISNYVPVLNASGNKNVFLNIPYFTSQTKLRQEISNFLVAIINLNAFIFLIGGLVALFITNRITRSFTFISNRMRQVNLGKVNESIRWNRKDEIGELVVEYNKMVAKLDESALNLAKSEREGAWREMARQVAHEIKNPLTPMKLSLQYLQKAIDEDTANVKELSKSVARTLVEQIDHLSQIASDFSQFANIGNPRNEIFDLNESLNMLARLYDSEKILILKWQPLNVRVLIKADKTHINRLFTNLIQNAMQSVPEGRFPQIEIEAFLTKENVMITVKDNGNGIPVNMQSKIFTPNFTTKSSGTGLGLAMCKGITEQSKGQIWFETKEGIGTKFFVELPLASVT